MDLGAPGPTPAVAARPRVGTPAVESFARVREMDAALRLIRSGTPADQVLGPAERESRLDYTAGACMALADRAGITLDQLAAGARQARTPREFFGQLGDAIARRQGIEGPPGPDHEATVDSIAGYVTAILAAPPDTDATIKSVIDRSVPALARLDGAIAQHQIVLGREPWLAAMGDAHGEQLPVWQGDEHPLAAQFAEMPGYQALGRAVDQWGSYPEEQLASIRAFAAGSNEGLSEETQMLAHVIRIAPHTAPALFRGVAVEGTPAEAIARFAPGTDHAWPIAAWSEDPGQASYFAERNVPLSGEHTRVIFELDPGATGFNTQAIAYRASSEREWLLGGGYTVGAVRMEGREVHVSVTQSVPASAVMPEV